MKRTALQFPLHGAMTAGTLQGGPAGPPAAWAAPRGDSPTTSVLADKPRLRPSSRGGGTGRGRSPLPHPYRTTALLNRRKSSGSVPRTQREWETPSRSHPREDGPPGRSLGQRGSPVPGTPAGGAHAAGAVRSRERLTGNRRPGNTVSSPGVLLPIAAA
jgi:hypothetical protein